MIRAIVRYVAYRTAVVIVAVAAIFFIVGLVLGVLV